jgi:ATP-dependent DNA helicase RecG
MAAMLGLRDSVLNRTARARPPARSGPASPPLAEPEAIVRLKRVLDLELKRGCDDTAVIGGLDAYLANARSDRPAAAFLDQAPRLPRGYRGLDRQARERWLRRVAAQKFQPARPQAKTRAAQKKEAQSESRPAQPGDPLSSPVTVIKGVKDATYARLRKLGVQTVRDLLYLFPNRHNDFADVRPIADLRVGEEQTAVVAVWNASLVNLGRRPGTQAVVGDSSGNMRVVWFNQTYLANQLKANDRIVLSGKVTLYNGMKTMESPEWERLQDEELTHTGRLVPVYPLTEGLSQRVLRRVVKDAVDRYASLLVDPLPDPLSARHNLLPLPEALRQMHYPDSQEQRESARRRLAFEELLCVQLAVLERRLAWEEGRAPAFDTRGILDVYRSALPFPLTGAQERVLGELAGDLSSSRPMARLLQGDVGSGKTAIAAAGLVVAAANGYQGAIMAPTEILAEQHYRTLTSLLKDLTFADRPPLRIELLTGSLTAAVKRQLSKAIAAGEVDVVVGTHALIQDTVSFHRLGLTVVDEQHRFGVVQRASLKERASNNGQTPHLLVMSATPIPRTLALTFYGDLEVSVIDEMPPGRVPIRTQWVSPEDRREAYAFVREQIREGRQAFVVCPLIDESAAVAARSAIQEHERLSKHVFPDLRLGLLHGRMSASEKEAVLQAFRRGEMEILVATTVIEVGIDIPNATVMVIEGADRFGLAQLHQLRGRVGRGSAQSYCLLLSDDPSESAKKRLQLLEDTNDGFALAEADLQIRGPGDYLGTRQSGMPDFQAADFSDIRLVEQARQEALRLLAEDPGLRRPDHAELGRAVVRMKRVVTGDAS